jgi:uncharacterized protein (TIGR03382 family)
VVPWGMSIASFVVASLLSFTGPDLEDQPPGTEETCAGEPSLEFVEPLDGAMLESPITVSYIEREACNCDTGGCSDDALYGVGLSANGEFYPLSGDPISVALPAGEHELTISGEAAFHSESATITITIIGTGDSGTESSSGGTTSSGAGNCAASRPGGAGALVLGLLVLVGLRRRS